MQIRRTGPRRVVALAVTSAIAAGLFVAPQAGVAAPTPPPNPTDGQITAAQAAKNSLATAVGQASGQQADAVSKRTQAINDQALAEQKSAYAESEWRNSEATAARLEATSKATNKRLDAATDRVAAARTRFAQYMQAVYMDGAPEGLTGTLLSADDPSALLQQSSYQQYAVENNVDVIGNMQTLTVEQSNLAAKARRDANAAKKAVVAKQKAKVVAEVAFSDAQQETRQRQTVVAYYDVLLPKLQSRIDTAAAALATLNGQRATYDRYQAEQRRLREIARQKALAEARRQAELRRQAIAAQQRQQAAERARNKNKKKSSSGGSSSGGGGSSFDPPPVYAPPAPTGSGWTQAKAAKALARAKSTLGTPYAWAGGGAGGPSYGVCDASNGAGGDCNVYGYDCSGLVMFAWKKNWAHYADTQYSQAGSVHPKKSKLKIGDLVFFGSRGGGNDLHHVAMYAGHGQIIEAPYSGGVVQYNSLNAYSDYYGATRPLT